VPPLAWVHFWLAWPVGAMGLLFGIPARQFWPSHAYANHLQWSGSQETKLKVGMRRL